MLAPGVHLGKQGKRCVEIGDDALVHRHQVVVREGADKGSLIGQGLGIHGRKRLGFVVAVRRVFRLLPGEHYTAFRPALGMFCFFLPPLPR